MGRELRMVPPNWDHPKIMLSNDAMEFQPMHDIRFEDAATEWKAGFAKWEAGERPRKECRDEEYWEYYGDPPSREYHRPWDDGEATWFQVWETVSEGTPVSPPFATKKELIEYLVENGDYWDQDRRRRGITTMDCEPWSRKAAEHFVNGPGWAPSMVLDSKGLRTGVEAIADLPSKEKSCSRTESAD